MMNDPVLMEEWLAVGWSSRVRQGELNARRVLIARLFCGAGDRDHAWEDLCIHRGTRLSLGQVKGCDLSLSLLGV